MGKRRLIMFCRFGFESEFFLADFSNRGHRFYSKKIKRGVHFLVALALDLRS
jgi:hypothetical protein